MLVSIALVRHKQASPFFPCLADLMKFIQPTLDREQRKQARIAGMRKSMKSMLAVADDEDRERIIGGFAARGVTLLESPKIEEKKTGNAILPKLRTM